MTPMLNLIVFGTENSSKENSVLVNLIFNGQIYIHCNKHVIECKVLNYNEAVHANT